MSIGEIVNIQDVVKIQ